MPGFFHFGELSAIFVSGTALAAGEFETDGITEDTGGPRRAAHQTGLQNHRSRGEPGCLFSGGMFMLPTNSVGG